MKAKKKILSLLFFIVTSNVMIFAQDEIVDIAYETEEVEAVETQDSSNANTFSDNYGNNPILDNVQYLNNRILINNRPASTKDIKNMMRQTSLQSYRKYAVGTGLRAAGNAMVISGGACMTGALAMFVCFPVWGENDGGPTATLFLGIMLVYAGVPALLGSIPLFVTGNILKSQATRNFGENYLSDEPVKRENQIQLNLNVNKNGVGLAIVF